MVYTPPQDKDEILNLMANLEKFINDPDFSPLDPLTKMAIIHYQFESIHPFYDGNGRTGRIINIFVFGITKPIRPTCAISKSLYYTKQNRLLQGATRCKN